MEEGQISFAQAMKILSIEDPAQLRILVTVGDLKAYRGEGTKEGWVFFEADVQEYLRSVLKGQA